MEAVAEAVVAEEQELRRRGAFRPPPVAKTKRSMTRYNAELREELESQHCIGSCALCGERFTGDAFGVIAAQAAHREEVHGLRKTNLKRKQAAEKRTERAKAKPAKRRRKTQQRRLARHEENAAVILDALRQHGPFKLRADIVDATGLSHNTVCRTLAALRHEGRVVLTAVP